MRTAFAAAYTVLAINGIGITAVTAAAIEFLDTLYESRRLSFEALDPWLRANTQPR